MEVTRSTFLKNVFWRFFERVGAQFVTFIVSIIIARLVTPEAFGIVALISVIIGILQVFIDSGLGNALIQKKDSDDIDFSTVFYANFVFCIVLYFVLFFLSPLISKFYGRGDLTKLIRVVGLTLIISSVKNVQQAYVSKHFLFKKFFYSTITGTIIAAIVGIILAKQGYGVWALVAQQLSNIACDTIIVFFTIKWKPKFVFSLIRLKSLYSYGWKMFVTSLINTTYTKMRELIIGKFYSSQNLAYYNRGNTISLLFVQNIDASLNSVLMPTLSNIQEDKERMKQIVQRTIKISTYVMSPCLIGLAAVAESFIKVLLTDVWLPCVPFLIIFCFANLLYPLYTANLNAIAASGRSDIYLKIEIIKKSIGFVLLLLMFKFGVVAIALSLLLERFFELFVDVIPSGKIIGFSLFSQIKEVIPNFIISLVMGVIVFFLGRIELNIYFILFLQIISGIIIYILLSIITRNESFLYISSILKNKIQRHSNG